MPDANQYEDFLFSFESGVNSGVEPVLLLKNQLAWAENATVRGGHITHRPPIKAQTFNYGTPPDPALMFLITSTKFQGAAVYRPDTGASQIIAQIGGHLLAFTPTGAEWVITDVSVPGDYNDANSSQVWMWQSEKWMIVQSGDGRRPIFYDGISSRRSQGDSEVLATASSFNPANVPAIGASVVVGLTANYTGPKNIRVLFNGAYYQILDAIASGENATLTPYTGVLGTPVVSGTDIVYSSTTVGTAAANAGPVATFNPYKVHITIDFTTPVAVTVGEEVQIASLPWKVEQVISPTQVKFIKDPPGAVVAAGMVVTRSSSLPSGIVGTVDVTFNHPGVGVAINVVLETPYVGNPTVVTIGTDQYLIAQITGMAPNSLALQNLTDVAGPAYVANKDILTIPELPPGRMGAYGMGRNWMCLTDGISFMGGDVVGGASGTDTYDYRDAVLKNTENTFLTGGGSFRIPGSGDFITSMTFAALLDASFGQGPLQIGTINRMFSCNTPVDKTTWAAITNPILSESMKGRGPTGQDSTLVINSDILFRTTEGAGSLIQGRRGFSEWGNKGISYEMRRLFRNDDRSLLSYGSSVEHDNRLLATANPTSTGPFIIHPYTAVLNFDLISGLTSQAPPVWEGQWNISKVIKWVQGNFGNMLRTFAFRLDKDDIIELIELLRYEDQHYDNVSDRIVWAYETAMVFNKDVKSPEEIVNLLNGEIYIKDVHGTVDFVVKYRPDFHPSWIPWTAFSISADPTSLTGYRTPLGFGKPTIDGTAENANNRSFPNGHFFQVRVEITGDCKVTAMRFACSKIPKTPFAPPVANTANPVQLIPSTGQDLPMP